MPHLQIAQEKDICKMAGNIHSICSRFKRYGYINAMAVDNSNGCHLHCGGTHFEWP